MAIRVNALTAKQKAVLIDGFAERALRDIGRKIDFKGVANACSVTLRRNGYLNAHIDPDDFERACAKARGGPRGKRPLSKGAGEFVTCCVAAMAATHPEIDRPHRMLRALAEYLRREGYPHPEIDADLFIATYKAAGGKNAL